MCFLIASQRSAPNSPQWFNTGLHWAYGIEGNPQGHMYVDPDTGTMRQSSNSYEHPQPHACFIQSVNDDLVNEGGIMDLWVREARLFKYGSGGSGNFGLMGEADSPEAILPLKRGRSGNLGVEASGGMSNNIVVNVDASGSSVEGNQAEGKALGLALSSAIQTELIKQQRPGGLLA